MNASRRKTGNHPGQRVLALYSTRDLPWIKSLLVSQHLRRCSECSGTVRSFRHTKCDLKEQARSGLLAAHENHIDWLRVEREMLGNIAVGVAAARCIENVGRQRRSIFGAAWILAGLSVLFVVGWLTHVPREQNVHLANSLARLVGLERPFASGTMLRSTEEGISVRTQGVTLVLHSPHSATVSAMGSSAVEARYIDENTGQVTIANVYGQ